MVHVMLVNRIQMDFGWTEEKRRKQRYLCIAFGILLSVYQRAPQEILMMDPSRSCDLLTATLLYSIKLFLPTTDDLIPLFLAVTSRGS